MQSILEEFISREGTDYGAVEYSLERKVEQLKAQLSQGDVVISFDPQTESCTLLTRRDFRATQAAMAADSDAGDYSPDE